MGGGSERTAKISLFSRKKKKKKKLVVWTMKRGVKLLGLWHFTEFTVFGVHLSVFVCP